MPEKTLHELIEDLIKKHPESEKDILEIESKAFKEMDALEEDLYYLQGGE